MYSSKESVNVLTALLVSAGVRHAVVCPGSRNAPIVHNLTECPDIECYPVTDERSAGFYALGMALCEAAPVAVCVTSGTALLNLAPAVAEAYYQHVPLVVISADRPPQWIDQLDGQTLTQPDALGRFVGRSVSLPEVTGQESRWYCKRLVCEALVEATGRGGRPVHINVPLSEPLFQFEVEQLPREAATIRYSATVGYREIEACGLRADFWAAKRPMIVIGQNREGLDDAQIQHLKQHAVVLYEPLGSDSGTTHFDEVLAVMGGDERLRPDFVLYGGMVVSKRLKQFLRKATDADFWELSPDGLLHDTFMRTKSVLECRFQDVLPHLESFVSDTKMWEEYFEKEFGELPDTSGFVGLWRQQLDRVVQVAASACPDYSQMAAVRLFEQQLRQPACGRAVVHYANSTAVRLSCIYSARYVYCNRGVNGIEGSLSTAAGFSLVYKDKVFCVIGDLSFFYDQNALWNQNLGGNFRILLLNNGRGGIFHLLPGLEQSPARDRFVAAEHHTTAEGICRQNDVAYLRAENMEQMQQGIDAFIRSESNRPVLLEVFTNPNDDERAFRDYYHSLSI